MTFSWDETDREDQLKRQGVQFNKVYTDEGNCEFCGTQLHGSAFECEKCNALTCTSCIGDDGRCLSCVGN